MRNSAHYFIIIHRPLGDLEYLRVCHDNTGRLTAADWFLKFIIVHDLQTREKNYFICNKWLSLDKEDGSINRLLSVSLNSQKSQFKYLFEKQTKEKVGFIFEYLIQKKKISRIN